MAKIEITKAELVWPGKYREDGVLAEASPVTLPMQVVEAVNQPSSTSEEWQNKLIWGDNLLAMGSLLDEFSGKIDLIYIDPPFATGGDFFINTAIGDEAPQVTGRGAPGETQAYRDTWKVEPYLAMMAERLRLIRRLLSPKGSLFLHCDWHVGHLLRAMGDEVFGPENFLNEIVWYYYNKFQGNVKRFASSHDVIFWYRKGPLHQFTPQLELRAEGKVKQLKRRWDKEKGSIVNAKGEDGKVIYRETDQRTVDDVWRISMLQPADRTENCGYPTQKPEALLHRIIQSASLEGDLVADFFCGSGTTLCVAEKLNRRWIGCDLGRWGIHATRKRLLSISASKPFVILNLGRKERQHWLDCAFHAEAGFSAERVQNDYVASMLKLYNAQPISGVAHIDGSKNEGTQPALVHVGSVAQPITTALVEAAVDACARSTYQELHVLGWEWETQRCDLLAQAALQQGVTLRLLQIPREVMEARQSTAGAGVRFFPLAIVEAEIQQTAERTARVQLKNFTLPGIEMVLEETPGRVKTWSDRIDSWAVDWSGQSDTFIQGWSAFRTRGERELPLHSAPHAYDHAGPHRVVVRVIDIFGNDTRQAYDVDICQGTREQN